MADTAPFPDTVIYKIASDGEWEEMINTGRYKGSAIDLKDGFIHFSTKDQVKETAARHFSQQTDLKLIAIDSSSLKDRLKWEASRGGDLFPHLYDTLKQDSILWTIPLPLSPDGNHIFPQELAK